jgi:hypothetical protein
MSGAIARMVGSEKDYRLWGTWDGMRVGSDTSPVSLVTLIRTVYEHLKDQGRISFPASVMPAFMGKTIIESGGIKHALSTESARGIMQLRPSVLDDCEIPKDFRLHRMAQVDCALRLVEQNDRNLQQPFNAVFGKLPEKKRRLLYGLLLTQAYQIGVGRTIELLQDEELGKAAQYFAAHADHLSAEDIQVGMIYHNLGRRDLGMLTLYYVTDVGIATEALETGAVAGYPMQDIRVTVYDGKHHPVDSKEVAFVTAGKKAFLDAVEKARPIVLEPIVELDITIPADAVGNITGDLSSRRGRILGNTTLGGNRVVIHSEIPLAEVRDYQSQLKSLTGGAGTYTVSFSRYEPVPPRTQQELAEKHVEAATA